MYLYIETSTLRVHIMLMLTCSLPCSYKHARYIVTFKQAHSTCIITSKHTYSTCTSQLKNMYISFKKTYILFKKTYSTCVVTFENSHSTSSHIRMYTFYMYSHIQTGICCTCTITFEHAHYSTGTSSTTVQHQ